MSEELTNQDISKGSLEKIFSDAKDFLPTVHDKVFHIRNGVIRRDESLWGDWIKKFQNFEPKEIKLN